MPTPPQIALRRAGPTDAPAIAALVNAAYAKWVPILGRKPMPMLVDYDRAVIDHRIDVAEAAGNLAALIETNAAPDHLFIENIAVAPAQQGQGLGVSLLEHAEALARRSRLDTLRLLTNGLMQTNIGLYQRHGYFITHIEERAPGWSVVHMTKSLGTP
jgi:ribosomal protein S18 acetylase RimI-like enzyme